MNQEDIIRMAQDAGFETAQIDLVRRFAAVLGDFAALVAAHEREECLKLVDEQIHNMTVLDSYPEQSGAIYQAIINIRARGEK
jgi:hypothetical protein